MINGEQLLLFFTKSAHHALVAIQCIDAGITFMHLCSLGRRLPVDVKDTLDKLGATDRKNNTCEATNVSHLYQRPNSECEDLGMRAWSAARQTS